jgi:predicted aspartyl protease
VKGWFIIDTGASNTFIEQTAIEKFKLKNITSNIKAQGAGPNRIDAKIYKNNSISFGSFKLEKCKVATIDLSPINNAFFEINMKKIDGVIGADILKKCRALIDFNKNYLYLKKPS